LADDEKIYQIPILAGSLILKFSLKLLRNRMDKVI